MHPTQLPVPQMKLPPACLSTTMPVLAIAWTAIRKPATQSSGAGAEPSSSAPPQARGEKASRFGSGLFWAVAEED